MSANLPLPGNVHAGISNNFQSAHIKDIFYFFRTISTYVPYSLIVAIPKLHIKWKRHETGTIFFKSSTDLTQNKNIIWYMLQDLKCANEIEFFSRKREPIGKIQLIYSTSKILKLLCRYKTNFYKMIALNWKFWFCSRTYF